MTTNCPRCGEPRRSGHDCLTGRRPPPGEWTLKIETFRGLTAGAEHFYGRIHEPEERFDPRHRSYGYGAKPGMDRPRVYDVMHELTTEEARDLTKKDFDELRPANRYVYKPGETTARHPTKDCILQEAIQQLHEWWDEPESTVR